MLDPDGLSNVFERGIKACCLVAHDEREGLVYLRFLQYRASVQHERIEVICRKSCAVFFKVPENFYSHARACTHGRPYRLRIKRIGRGLSDYRNILNAESQAAPYDRAQVAAVRRIDQHHVVAAADPDLLLFDNGDDEAVILLGKDVERLFLCGYRDAAAAYFVYAGDRFLGPEARMKYHGLDGFPLFEKIFHRNGRTEPVCVYIVAFVTANFNQFVFSLTDNLYANIFLY